MQENLKGITSNATLKLRNSHCQLHWQPQAASATGSLALALAVRLSDSLICQNTFEVEVQFGYLNHWQLQLELEVASDSELQVEVRRRAGESD